MKQWELAAAVKQNTECFVEEFEEKIQKLTIISVRNALLPPHQSLRDPLQGEVWDSLGLANVLVLAQMFKGLHCSSCSSFKKALGSC